ncbi:MAG: hypothetical protein Q9165_006723 [Trypethelium subeluteriae]
MFRTKHVAPLFFSSLPFSLAQSPFVVPFNTTYLGPDGPWQAISIGVGGSDPNNPISLQQSTVDVLPGGQGVTFVLTPEACQSYSSGTCGQGGLWSPKPAQDTTYNFSIPPDINAVPGLNVNGSTEFMVAVSIQEATAWNVSVSAATSAVCTNSDGSTRPPEVGLLALGGNLSQTVLGGPSNQGQYETYTFPGGLYHQSATPSYSFGLHIGSASLNYPGSLLFGGYDKGRTIGPCAIFDATLQLLDVGVGVESGGSPFNFSSRQGLLTNDSNSAGPITVGVDPELPYLHLPADTCEAIASFLPVTYNSTAKYYLWNTEDPLYRKIVQSTAYLSFTFEGDSLNVTIKVPFVLLNLNLTSPLVSSPTPYFPCQPYQLPPTTASNSFYILGRAFLQAAFLGRNWQSGTSWLVQAPGPGVSNAGLGLDYTAIQPTDVVLATNEDMSLFAQSWQGHWTSLSTDGSVPGTGPIHPVPPHASGLSTRAKTGIGVSITLVGLLGVGVAILYLFRRRSRAQPSREPFSSAQKAPKKGVQWYRYEMDGTTAPKEFPNGVEILPELSSRNNTSLSLSSGRDR